MNEARATLIFHWPLCDWELPRWWPPQARSTQAILIYWDRFCWVQLLQPRKCQLFVLILTVHAVSLCLWCIKQESRYLPPPFHATKISPVFQLQNYLQSHTYSTIHEASNSERNLVEHKVLLTQRRPNAHIY